MPTKVRIALTLGILLLSSSPTFALDAAAIKSASSEPIKIGFVTSLTGVGGSPGQQMINGVSLYLDQINHQMAGRKVELIVENDGSSAATAIAKLVKLVNEDKVQVLDGIIGAHIAYAVAPTVDKLEVPMVLPVTGADDLTKRKRGNWLIRTGYSASQISQPFGEYAYKKLGYKRIACFGMDFPFSYEIIGGFQRTFEESGGKVVQKIYAPLGFTDFSTFLKQLRPDVDAIFLASALGAAPIVAKQIKQYGPKLPLIGYGTAFDESVLRAAGDNVLGAVSCSNYSAALDNPANKQFVKAFRAKYNIDPTQVAEYCYTSAMWIHKAVDAVKGDVENKQKFLAALKKVKLSEAPRGSFSLDTYGNPVENIYVRKVEKVNGNLQDTVVHTFPNVSQFWTYDPETFLKDPPYSKNYPPCKNCPSGE